MTEETTPVLKTAGEQYNDAVRKASADRNAAARGQNPSVARVILPQGIPMSVEEFVMPGFNQETNREFFEPWRAVKDPVRLSDGQFHYGWAKKDDPHTLAKLRSQCYVKVTVDEIKDDTDAAYVMTQEGADQSVEWVDLILFRFTEKGWREHYTVPLNFAGARLNRVQPKMQEKMSVDDHGNRIEGIHAEVTQIE